jgi:hypothetical protein
MDILEEAAFSYLELEYSKVDFEPNGQKTFPDFLCDNSVLVEVTRLDHSVKYAGKRRNLTEMFRPLLDGIERVLGDTDLSGLPARHYFLNLSVKFPIDKVLAQKSLRKFLLKWRRARRHKVPVEWSAINCAKV